MYIAGLRHHNVCVPFFARVSPIKNYTSFADNRIGLPIERNLTSFGVQLIPDIPLAPRKSSSKAKSLYRFVWDSFNFGTSEICSNDTTSEEEHLLAHDNLETLVECLELELRKKRVFYLQEGTHIQLGKNRLLVTELTIKTDVAISHPKLGLAFPDCQIIIREDSQLGLEFDSVHIAPLIDTIPEVYNVHLYTELLEPHLVSRPLELFAEGDIITISSVQFKIIQSKPESRPLSGAIESAALSFRSIEQLLDLRPRNPRRRRIGPHTQLYLSLPILPHWIDILPRHCAEVVMMLPIALQTMCIVQFLHQTSAADIERVLNANRLLKMTNSINRLENIRLRLESLVLPAPSPQGSSTSQSKECFCAVCLSEDQGNLIKLPCEHIFHMECIANWLLRTQSCPMCKAEFNMED